MKLRGRKTLSIVIAVALGFCITWLVLNKDSFNTTAAATEEQHQADTDVLADFRTS